jgi:hypothetical protein
VEPFQETLEVVFFVEFRHKRDKGVIGFRDMD